MVGALHLVEWGRQGALVLPQRRNGSLGRGNETHCGH